MEFASDEAEATAVVEEIEVQRMSGRIPWKDQAILFRTNLQSRPLETALRQARVSYRLVGGQSYFDRREIKDVLAFLKVLINPDDDISLLRIANVPPRGLSSKTMQNLLALSEARSTSVGAVMRHTDLSDQLHAAASRSARALVSMFEERMAQLEEKSLMLGPWARTFLETIGYFGDLARSEKDPKVAENRVQGAKELLESIDTLTQSMGLVSGRERLERFLEAVALDQDRFDDKETEGEGVTLITMHSCKGLEFPHVHIVGLEQGLLPHSRSIDEGSMDEERRLFYVALTRAMKSLTLSHCATRQKFGQAMPCHPSSFLSELPSELIEIADDVFKKPVSASSGAAMFDALKNSLEL
jgi:superfamily I DNA/RNA helicase